MIEEKWSCVLCGKEFIVNGNSRYTQNTYICPICIWEEEQQEKQEKELTVNGVIL